MSQFTDQANSLFSELRSKVDCSCLGLKNPDGSTLSEVWLHPLTVAVHCRIENAMGSGREGEFDAALFEYFLTSAQTEDGKAVFDKADREALPYRLPKARVTKLLNGIANAMRNDHEAFVEAAKGNSDGADT